MKIRIIKGPNHEKTLERGYQYMYDIISKKVKEEQANKEIKNHKKEEK